MTKDFNKSNFEEKFIKEFIKEEDFLMSSMYKVYYCYGVSLGVLGSLR